MDATVLVSPFHSIEQRRSTFSVQRLWERVDDTLCQNVARAINVLKFYLSTLHKLLLQNLSCVVLNLQLLMRSGYSPEETMMMMVPEAYKKHPTLMVKYPEVGCQDV